MVALTTDYSLRCKQQIRLLTSNLTVASCTSDLVPRYGEYVKDVVENIFSLSNPEENANSLLGLPYICFYTLSENLESIDALAGIWGTNYLAIYLLDKVEDEELDKKLFQSHLPGTLVNLSIALIIASLNVLDHQGICPNEEIRTDLRTQISTTLMEMANAQHHDLMKTAKNIDQCWKIVEAKSGLFFRLGCFIGIRLATNQADIIRAFTDYGFHLGILVQIVNDIAGLWKKDHTGDICTCRNTLPIVYAREYYAKRMDTMFEVLLDDAKGASVAEYAARKMVIESGAIIYLCLQAEIHKKAAITAIKSIQKELKHPELLIDIAEKIFQPHEIIPSQVNH